jgi:hypothetical protein
MAYQAINKENFNYEHSGLSAKRLLRTVWLNGLTILFAMLIGCAPAPTPDPPGESKRLCENNDNPVATISPCEGPIGTVITVTPGRQLSSAPALLIFKKTLSAGLPSQVISPISDNTITTQPTHCLGGNGRWEVWLVLADGQSQGKIGAFTTTGCVGGGSSGLGKPPGGDNAENDPPKELIILPPITMNVDNEVYAKTRNTSQSYIKNIASSVPEVATGTEWGTNEVKIHGKKPGVTIISFLDDNTGTFYQVEVTVKDPTEGGAGGGEGSFIKTEKLVYSPDQQILVKYFGLPGNKHDWITIVKVDTADNQFAEWFYTEGKVTGDHLFKGLPAGNYEARLYFNWPEGKYQVKSRYRFTVQENQSQMDPCLVGQWEAFDVTVLGVVKWAGGTGFRVTFKSDGTQITDYSTMKPFTTERETLTYSGTATGKISTNNRIARIESIEKAGVRADFRGLNEWGNSLTSFGPGGLGTTTNDNGYVCTQETLEYKTSVGENEARGKPSYSVKFRRLSN